MDVTITIPSPVLVAGQFFIVQYRLLGNPSWIGVPPQTNAPFTITGLAAGIYELWTQLAEGSPGILCEERIDTFTVSQDVACMDYSAELVKGETTTVNLIVAVSSIPSPVVFCGLRFSYYPVGNPGAVITVNYAVPPINSTYTFPASAVDYHLTVTQIGCDGSEIICFDDDVEYVSAGCIPASFGTAELNLHPNNTWWVVLNFIQSIPPSTLINASYYQDNNVNTGIPDPGGTLNLAANSMTIALTFQVFPNTDVVFTNGQRRISYVGNFTDQCRFSTKWVCFFDLN